MSLRLAQAKDAADILAIWNPIIRDSEATFNSVEKSAADVTDMIARRARDGHATLVAEQAGRVLGFGTYAQFRGGIGYAHTMEHTVMLAPKAQGQGLGRALMAALEDHARGAGGHSMFAGVSSGNPDGVAFHARLGYVQVALLQAVGRKFDRWYDLHLMQKLL